MCLFQRLGLAFGCLIAAAVGFVSAPHSGQATAASPQQPWSALPNISEAVRIEPPTQAQAPGWPELRARLAIASASEFPDLLGDVWNRLTDTDREVWLRTALIHWVALDPDGAVSQVRKWGDSPLGKWLVKEGLPLAFDRWARADALAALAYINDHKVPNIRLGSALSGLPAETFVAWMAGYRSGLGHQDDALRALASSAPDQAFQLLATMNGSIAFGYGEVLITALAMKDPERTIATIRSRSDDPNANGGCHRVYGAWAKHDLKAAMAHREKTFPKLSPETLIAHAHAEDGVPAVMKALADHGIAEPTYEIFGSIAIALGTHPMPVDEAIPIIDALVYEGYDPLKDSVRFHDRFPGLKRNLNKHGWPPDGQEIALYHQLLERPAGNGRDALLGATVSKVGETSLEQAVDLAVQAANEGALWVFEGLNRKLDGRFELKMEIARALDGVQLNSFHSVLNRDTNDNPRRLADAITSMGDHPSKRSLTWHLMETWHRQEPEGALAWLEQQPPSVQTDGEAALARSLSIGAASRWETTAERLMAVEVPFWEHDRALRSALRNWARRDSFDVEEAIEQASHYDAAYREKLRGFVFDHRSYAFP